MGRRGPAPLPNGQRVATHASRQLDAPEQLGVDAPPEDTTWHPQAQVWYLSLAGTPQADGYTRADWGTAHTYAAALSGAMKANDWRTVGSILNDAARHLGTTRIARLQSHLDIDDDTPAVAAAGAEADVVDLATNAELRERTFGTAPA